jgi:hypothetical protein
VQEVPKDFEPEYETWIAEWQMLEVEAQKVDEVPEALDTKIKELRERIDKAIAGLAAREEVKSLLLNRWDKDPKKWPPHEVDGVNVEISRVPAAQVKAHGPCASLAAEPGEARPPVRLGHPEEDVPARDVGLAHEATHLKDDLDTIELSFESRSRTRSRRSRSPAPGGDPATSRRSTATRASRRWSPTWPSASA